MNDRIAELEKEVERLTRFETIIKHAMADKIAENTGTSHYFICGEGGEKDRQGLPEFILVCPAPGLDRFYAYRRVKTS